MAERTAISQGVSLGVEVIPGTAVTATRRLGSIGFSPAVKVETSEQTPIGAKFANAQILGKEWSESAIEGAPCYTELPYVFSSLFSTATVAQIMDSATPTGAYTWAFPIATNAADNPKTFTIEQGSSVRAHRVANAIISELQMEFSRDEVTFSGAAIGKAIEDGITLSGTPTMLPQVMVRPTDVSVYIDTTAAGLGTTKMLRTLSGSVKVSDRFGPLFVVDSAQSSFVATMETKPKAELELMMEADAQGMGPLVTMRAGSTSFVRIEATGATIYTGGVTVKHRFRWDFAGQVSDVSEFSDEDGVYAIGWTLGAVHDATWDKSMAVEVITTTTAL